MKFTNLHKRIGAFVLSVAMMSAVAGDFVSAPVRAAGNNKIEFKEIIWDNEYIYTDNTVVVSGYGVGTRIQIDNSWVYTTPPFSFRWPGAPSGATAQNPREDGSSGYIPLNHPLVREQNMTGPVDWIQYEVNPRLSVNVQNGFGTFTYDRVVDSGTPQPATVSVTVKSSSPLPVTSNCSLTFRTVNGQMDADGAQSLSFEPVTSATGTWASNYVGATVTTKEVKDKEFTIEVRPQAGGNPTEDKMVFTVTSPMNKVPKGAVFTLNYTYDALNGLTLTATTPERTVQDVKSDMRNLIGASETGKKLPYLAFNNTSDTQNMVTGSFKLLNTFYKYNSKMKIDWSVKDSGGTYVDIQQQRGSQQVTAVLQNIPPDDVDVTLVATIGFYEGAGVGTTTTHEVPLTLLGTGTRPSVAVVKQAFGTNQGGAQNIREALITDNIFPTRMEVYDGSITHVAPLAVQETWPPFRVDANLKFGYARGRANNVKITATGSGKVEFRKDGEPNGKVLDANGVTIQNTSTGSLQQITPGSFVGKEAGAVSIKIEYFNAQGAIAPAYTYNVTVEDHSPKSDASLKQLDAQLALIADATDDQKEAFKATYPGGMLTYGFDPKTFTFNVTVPDVVETIRLRPVYNHISNYPGVNQDVSIAVTPAGASIPNVPNNMFSDPIKLGQDGTTTITARSIAEDGTLATYTLNILRSSKSIDNSLKDIVVTQKNPEKTNVPLAPAFSPTIFNYNITVPYSVDKLNVKAIANDAWAYKPEIQSDGPQANIFQRLFENASNKDVQLRYDVIDPVNQQVNNVTQVTVTVKPENQNISEQVYTIRITRSPPDHNANLGSLRLLRNKEGEEVKLDGKGFDKNQRTFYATVPYSTDLLRLELQPESDLAKQVRIEATAGSKKSQTLQYIKKGTPLSFTFSGLGQGSTPDPSLDEITFTIWVMPESDQETDPPYQLIVTRSPPDSDTNLGALTVINAADEKPVPGFSFNPVKREYSFSVDYTVDAVVVTPTAKSKLSKVYVNGKLVNENMPSRTVKLTPGGVTKITVLVVPESGEAQQGTYVLNITRTTPSNEARLINLVVNGGTDQKPTPFIPSTTSYSWSIPEGTKDFTVTATPVDANATITVDGKAAPNGGASDKIVSTTANSTIQVVVTAQDGKTTKTYTIKITNYNFIKKSDNADLASLKVNHGQLAPAFNPTVLEYEVYVKPTAMSLAITPRPANSKATVEVKHGNRVLSEFDGAHTSSLLEDETTFVITVTSEDKKVTKTYTLYVYRNDEEKSGVFAPITPDMVDFETSNPIIIDIATYPVVDALVFNTLKTEYPDKTILFKGNDYTLELKGSDMDTLVPHTATFDLSFSFTTPEKTAIENLLYDMGSDNDRLEPVYIYFDHHGTLPAPMLLTVSLGKKYSNETIYWNYYNQERDRIDYYGYVNTNAKGTFSVPIEHFSTFFVTISRVRGAENKSGLDYSSMPQMEEIGIETPTQKVNPNTGGAGATLPQEAGGTR